jgi:hypothetical protein
MVIDFKPNPRSALRLGFRCNVGFFVTRIGRSDETTKKSIYTASLGLLSFSFFFFFLRPKFRIC